MKINENEYRTIKNLQAMWSFFLFNSRLNLKYKLEESSKSWRNLPLCLGKRVSQCIPNIAESPTWKCFEWVAALRLLLETFFFIVLDSIIGFREVWFESTEIGVVVQAMVREKHVYSVYRGFFGGRMSSVTIY